MEKWLSGGSPMGSPMGPRRKQPVRRKPMSKTKGHYRPKHPKRNLALARFGTPIQLFKDSDRDGVSNVFDCSPYNKKKQDVISPANFGGGVRDMYARREGSRLNRKYNQQIKEAQRLERLRLKELQRIGALPVQIVDNTRTIFRDTNTRYVITKGGDWVTATSKEGKQALKDAQANSELMVPVSGNATFMEGLGYTGQPTTTGTVWTKPATAPSSSSPAPSSGGGGSSSGTTWSAPVTRSDGSTIQMGTVAPTYAKPAPKKQPWYRRILRRR